MEDCAGGDPFDDNCQVSLLREGAATPTIRGALVICDNRLCFRQPAASAAHAICAGLRYLRAICYGL